MKRMNKITILGCGSSVGVPLVGCSCAICCSDNPFNKRLRPSIFIELQNGANILIDASTDFRQQALKYNIQKIDAVFITHGHADHILGIDDLRPYNFVINKSLPLYLTPETFRIVRGTFSYIFNNQKQESWVVKFKVFEIDEYKPFDLFGVNIKPFAMHHGKIRATGFRIGNFSYATDCKYMPPRSIEIIRNSRYMIIDSLREKAAPTHLSVPEAYEIARLGGVKQTYLTHLNHEVDYNYLSSKYPENFQPAYDGLQFFCD
jgi:phosphoribosyl 1,2-cyclic phosphate phosphodiesterase